MSERELYVGYLPESPPAVGRFTRRVVVLLLSSATVLAAAVTSFQGRFSDGRFEFGVVRSFEGWIESSPYPQLLVQRPGGGLSSYLLVGFGKSGAEDAVVGFDGRAVRLDGTVIHRDGRTMVELVDGSLEVLQGAPDAPANSASGGSSEASPLMAEGAASFVGEIVDSKCFLGVMKPGAAKPHRACATRCISGGVPPVLLLRHGDGRATYLLLVDASGGSIGREVVDRGLVAEPVRVSGRVERMGDWLVLHADPSAIERVP